MHQKTSDRARAPDFLIYGQKFDPIQHDKCSGAGASDQISDSVAGCFLNIADTPLNMINPTTATIPDPKVTVIGAIRLNRTRETPVAATNKITQCPGTSD
jgi:hypothetical protein